MIAEEGQSLENVQSPEWEPGFSRCKPTKLLFFLTFSHLTLSEKRRTQLAHPTPEQISPETNEVEASHLHRPVLSPWKES